ncbi:phospholipase DDHD2-like isoform X2 [Carassius auratus]|uniref:Phospholipase DDHD2-like isoform X2 n=1 Tax=Carassius auratus TaxID=7957 RepID=A0A6P6Q762_CARAU|nr:phospholipase DDHD2-like isoform X2 [Carassius auratus]
MSSHRVLKISRPERSSFYWSWRVVPHVLIMNVVEPYEPVQHHWFYNQQTDSKDSWQPFSREDSQRLEEAYSRGKKEKDEVVVATDGRRYDVRLRERQRYSVYWEQKPAEVRRCSWFHKGNKDLNYTPYSEDLSDFLEDAYMIAMTLNEWKQNVELPTGDTVILHNPKLMMQYPSSCKEFPPSPNERTQPRTLKRGTENIPVEIPEGEPEMVDHLVFMVHGIGPACDIRLRGIVQCVNEFRNASNSLLKSHFRQSEGSCIIGRVEYLPVNWHKVLHGETIGVDKDIERITLPSISRLRQFSNDTVLDLFFYNSATYCQTIVDTVASEINRLHSLFLQRHPDFTGHASLVGHSLGSLILFDLLTNQETDADGTPHELREDAHVDPGCGSYESLEEVLKGHGLEEHLNTLHREQMDMESLMLCSEKDLKDIGIPLGPRKKMMNCVKKWKHSRSGSGHAAKNETHSPSLGMRNEHHTPTTSAVDYQHFDVGIGQVSIDYPQLAFHPQAFFAMGSPIGMFLIVRGLKRIDPNYSFPTCKSFYNIFHPFDPVAYRIEPMILPQDMDLPPMLIPHHKGRKRMHLELKEGLTRVSSDLLGSLRMVWQSISQVPAPALAEGGISSMTPTDEAEVSPMEQEERNFPKVGTLNRGRRIDFVLQETPIESFNEYLFAIQSHLCYWESEDTALLVLREIYGNIPARNTNF